MPDFLIRLIPFFMVALLTGMAPAMHASTHPANAATADGAIHLVGEADLVMALVAHLEEAVRLSSTMAATSNSGSLHGFARKEIHNRTGQIAQLRKWCRRWFDDSCNRTGTAGLPPGNTPISSLAYASAMSANHARLLEVIEFGFGVKPRKAARELMERIQQEGYDELAFLEQSAGTPAGRIAPSSRNGR